MALSPICERIEPTPRSGKMASKTFVQFKAKQPHDEAVLGNKNPSITVLRDRLGLAKQIRQGFPSF